MKPYRILTDGKRFKIQEQVGWFRKRWVDWPSSIFFGTAEDAEKQIRRLCNDDEWEIVKTFNTGLHDVVWQRLPVETAENRPLPPPPPPREIWNL